jgi:hypothetical protein
MSRSSQDSRLVKVMTTDTTRTMAPMASNTSETT